MRTLTRHAVLLLFIQPALGFLAYAQTPTPVPDRTNVCSFGAVPNNGLPDTTAIQNAINAPTPTPPPGTGAAPKSIYFPRGTYNITAQLTLLDKTSYRLYGDGPGVSILIFESTGGGFLANNVDASTLNIEGLTLQAAAPATTAIKATFGNAPRTATIHNVQIIGSTDGVTGYWSTGIQLTNASNSMIDKVEIVGKRGSTQNGLIFDSNPPGLPGAPPGGQNGGATTSLFLSNLQIKWCNTALRTSLAGLPSHVEGLYLNGFEFISCGRNGPAVDFDSAGGGGGTFSIVNGRIESPGNGMEVSNGAIPNCSPCPADRFSWLKVANVHFRHYDSSVDEGVNLGTLLSLNHVTIAVVADCSFYGSGVNGVAENGLILNDVAQAQITGNTFTNMTPGAGNGSCVVVDPPYSPAQTPCSAIRLLDNLFYNFSNQYSIPPSVFLYQNNP